MEFIYNLLSSFGFDPELFVEGILGEIPTLAAFPIMILMMILIPIIGTIGLLFGFSFDEITNITDVISGVCVMVMEFIYSLFGGSL